MMPPLQPFNLPAFQPSPLPRPALSAALADELQVVDDDAFFGALAHVVDGEGGDSAGGHRFHLHAGLSVAAGDGVDFDDAVPRGEVEGDVDGVELDGMGGGD